MTEFETWFSEARKSAGCKTKIALARKTGLSLSTITNVENSKRLDINFATSKAIADALNVDHDEMQRKLLEGQQQAAARIKPPGEQIAGSAQSMKIVSDILNDVPADARTKTKRKLDALMSLLTGDQVLPADARGAAFEKDPSASRAKKKKRGT